MSKVKIIYYVPHCGASSPKNGCFCNGYLNPTCTDYTGIGECDNLLYDQKCILETETKKFEFKDDCGCYYVVKIGNKDYGGYWIEYLEYDGEILVDYREKETCDDCPCNEEDDKK